MLTLLVALIVVPAEEKHNLDLLIVNDVFFLRDGEWHHSYRQLVPIEWVDGEWHCLGYWWVPKHKRPLLQPDGSYRYLTTTRFGGKIVCIKAKFVLFLTTNYDIGIAMRGANRGRLK